MWRCRCLRAWPLRFILPMARLQKSCWVSRSGACSCNDAFMPRPFCKSKRSLRRRWLPLHEDRRPDLLEAGPYACASGAGGCRDNFADAVCSRIFFRFARDECEVCAARTDGVASGRSYIGYVRAVGEEYLWRLVARRFRIVAAVWRPRDGTGGSAIACDGYVALAGAGVWLGAGGLHSVSCESVAQWTDTGGCSSLRGQRRISCKPARRGCDSIDWRWRTCCRMSFLTSWGSLRYRLSPH